MKLDVKDISETQKKLVVEIPKDKVDEEMKSTLNEIKRTMPVKGFRPGKVPLSILKMRFGKEINQQIGAKLIEDSIEEALEKSELKAVGEPKMSDWELTEGEPFSYEVELTIIPKFEIKDFKGIAVENPVKPIAEVQIDEGLERVRQSNATYEVVENRESRDDDRIIGRVTIEIDGSPVPGWKNRSFDTVIGSGKMFPGSEFENNLTGIKTDTLHDFKLKFDENYDYYKDFAGKTAKITVDVSEIKEKKLPDLDDELAKDLGLDSLDDLKQQIQGDLTKKQDEENQNQLKILVVDALLDKNDFAIPELLVESELDRMMSQFQMMGNQDDEQFNKLREEFKKLAEKNVRQRLALEQIAEQESIEISDDDIDDEFEKAFDQSSMPLAEFQELWDKNDMSSRVKEDLKRQKALDLLVENANVTQVDVIEDEKTEEEEKDKDIPGSAEEKSAETDANEKE